MLYVTPSMVRTMMATVVTKVPHSHTPSALLSPHTDEGTGPERIGDLLRVTQPVDDRAETHSQLCSPLPCKPNPILSFHGLRTLASGKTRPDISEPKN